MDRLTANILRRVMVNTFYKDNTGFFLFCFFILFGAVSGGQLIGFHLSLINGIIQSYVFLGCVIIAWLLYTFKCNSYVCKKLKDPHNDFLLVLGKTTPQQQYFQMLVVHLQVYMPVLLYAFLVAGIAFQKGYHITAAITLAGNCIMIIFSAFLYRFYLQKKETRRFSFLSGNTPSIGKPLFSLPFWFIWKERKQILFTIKLFTFGIIYLFSTFYEAERHDVRPLMLILLLVAAAHSFVVLRVRQFEETYLGFGRNLPVGILKRFAGVIILYTLFLLPEFIFVWKAFPAAFNIADYPQLVLFTVSLPVFFHCILLMKDTDADSYMRIMFITCAVVFFIVLYDPGIALALAVMALSFVFFSSHFYTFEKEHT